MTQSFVIQIHKEFSMRTVVTKMAKPSNSKNFRS